jgi:hypothetical protein
MIVYNDYNLYHYEYVSVLLICNHWTKGVHIIKEVFTTDVAVFLICNPCTCTAEERHITHQTTMLENVDEALLPTEKKTGGKTHTPDLHCWRMSMRLLLLLWSRSAGNVNHLPDTHRHTDTQTHTHTHTHTRTYIHRSIHTYSFHNKKHKPFACRLVSSQHEI